MAIQELLNRIAEDVDALRAAVSTYNSELAQSRSDRDAALAERDAAVTALRAVQDQALDLATQEGEVQS